MSRFWQIDAFAERPFQGNPAAVVLLEEPCSEQWMQSVAAEMNLSETAFLEREGDHSNPSNQWALRWFTPLCEVNLCGHATLAAAHALREVGCGKHLTFQTRSGPLSATISDSAITLDFPAAIPQFLAADARLAVILGAPPLWQGRAGEDLLVEVASHEVLRTLRPDLHAIRALEFRGIIVTAAPGATDDFESRFFAPRFGIAEDSVTGSAHCALGPFWAERLGKSTLTGWQCSARGGRVNVCWQGDRVLVTGTAQTVLRGEICADSATTSLS